MKIVVSCESTCDLSPELLTIYKVSVIPYSVMLGEREFKDGEISTGELFAYVDESGKLPRTAAINQFEYEEYFRSLRKEYDAVIHICLSSELSSSCSHAFDAAKNVMQDENAAYLLSQKFIDKYSVYNMGIAGHNFFKVCQYIPANLKLYEKIKEEIKKFFDDLFK